MGDKSAESLMQYLNGEISFFDWLEIDSSKSDDKKDQERGGEGSKDDNDGSEAEEDNEEDTEPSEINTSTVPSPASVVESEEFSGEKEESTIETQNVLSLKTEPASTSQSLRPRHMTDLLLGLPAAKKARKHGGTSVDEFLRDIPMSRKRKSGRPRRNEVPQKYRRQMGEANICCAKGDYEKTKEICIDIIKQAPKCPEPFQILGMVYEMQDDLEKALQFFLITAYLNKSADVEEWLKLASMSLEQGNYKQALACYNQALKHEPDNLSILWDRAALCYQMNDTKKAMEGYEAVLKALPQDDEERFMDLATEMAMIYHENNSLKKAIDVMEVAFSRNPNCSDFKAINMLGELYITAKQYARALKIICTFCKITQEVSTKDSETSEPLSSFSNILGYDREESPQKPKASTGLDMNSSAKWIIPEEIPIDLRVKTVVCLIHLRKLSPVKDIISPLFLESVEAVGDLYLDVADAYAENGDYEEALPVLNALVVTSKYNQAGVWLKKAQSLMSLGHTEQAVLAYDQVVTLAPSHLEARLTLASLHQQLGRPDKALDILTEKTSEQEGEETCTPMEFGADQEYVQAMETEEDAPFKDTMQPQDFRLMFHKCTLLKSQNRPNEFIEAGLRMFDLYFKDVSNKSCEEVIHYAGIKLMKNKQHFWVNKERTKKRDKEEGNSHSANTGNNMGVRIEEWWDMLKELVIKMSCLKDHEGALHLIMCGLASRRLMFFKEYQRELQFMGVIAFYLTGKYKLAFDYIRQLLVSRPQNIVLWNIVSRIVAKAEDSRHHRYCLRQLIKYPDLLPLVIINGHNSFVAGGYKFAIAEYIRAFRQNPDNPLLSLCLGIQYIHLACQRFPFRRHSIVVQGILFLFQYLGLRGECQEVYYNLGRAFHQMGLLHFSVHYYKKALDWPYHNAKETAHSQAELSEKHDLHREAAFNLSLIYRESGNTVLAKELIAKHIVI